jgi:hypothetical protein
MYHGSVECEESNKKTDKFEDPMELVLGLEEKDRENFGFRLTSYLCLSRAPTRGTGRW